MMNISYVLEAVGDDGETVRLGKMPLPEEWSTERQLATLMDKFWDSRLDAASCRPCMYGEDD